MKREADEHFSIIFGSVYMPFAAAHILRVTDILQVALKSAERDPTATTA